MVFPSAVEAFPQGQGSGGEPRGSFPYILGQGAVFFYHYEFTRALAQTFP